jgi:hypothetical protein
VEGKDRKLKVYSKAVRRVSGYKHLPEIRLMGIWLQDIGFEIDSNVSVMYSDGKITIVLEEVSSYRAKNT